MPSLLPPSATAQEHALAEAVARLTEVPVPVKKLWNPDDCPPEFLPWLAWALSVDQWDEAWTDAQKRAAVKNANWIHRHKGTGGAVRRAVSALGYTVRIREWWQEEPKGEPYTYRIEIDVDDRGVDAALYESLKATVNSAKNTRSHLSGFSVALAGRGDTPRVAAAAVTARQP